LHMFFELGAQACRRLDAVKAAIRPVRNTGNRPMFYGIALNSDFRATDMTPSPEQGIQAAWCGILVSIRRIARHTSPLLPQTLYNMADNMAEAGS